MLFFISPEESYRFSSLLENHAVDTYQEFVESNKELLRSLPSPDVAYEYYDNFLYYFYEFQLSESAQPDELGRRPEIGSLLDVFQNILLDEVSSSLNTVFSSRHLGTVKLSLTRKLDCINSKSILGQWKPVQTTASEAIGFGSMASACQRVPVGGMSSLLKRGKSFGSSGLRFAKTLIRTIMVGVEHLSAPRCPCESSNNGDMENVVTVVA